MEGLEGVDRLMMSGARATLVLADGATLTEAQAKAAVEGAGLTFESFATAEVSRAARAFVAETPGFT